MTCHEAKPSAHTRWRHRTGVATEDLAARFLESRGCEVLARRFRSPRGEVDIIIDDHGILAFVEVKARRGRRFGTPVESVTKDKQRRIARAARYFVRASCPRRRHCRFDVVSVDLCGGRARVRWIRDAFGS